VGAFAFQAHHGCGSVLIMRAGAIFYKILRVRVQIIVAGGVQIFVAGGVQIFVAGGVQISGGALLLFFALFLHTISGPGFHYFLTTFCYSFWAISNHHGYGKWVTPVDNSVRTSGDAIFGAGFRGFPLCALGRYRGGFNHRWIVANGTPVLRWISRPETPCAASAITASTSGFRLAFRAATASDWRRRWESVSWV